MAGSATIGSLRVDLGINSAQFQTGVKRAQSTLGSLGASFKAFAAGALAALSFGAITHAITSTIDHFDELGKASQKIGITVEALSKLEYAAKLADVSFEQLQLGVGKLSKAMAGIAGGQGGDAGKALAAIGVSALDAQGKLRPTEAVIGDIAQAFSGLKDGAGKTALAMAIFGKSGAELIPLLNEGKKGLADSAAEATIFGQVVSGLSAKAAEQFNDNLNKLKAAASGLTAKFVTELLPSLVALTDKIVDLAKNTDFASWFSGLTEYAATTAKEFNALAGIIERVMTLQSEVSVADPNANRAVSGAELRGELTMTGDGKGDRLPTFTPPPKKDAPNFLTDPGTKKLSEAFLQSQYDAKQLNDGVLALSQTFKDTGDAAATLGQQMAQSLGADVMGWLDQAIAGTLDLKDALFSVLQDFTKLALNSAFTTFMNNAANPVQGGGFAGAIASLFGFASGGSFKVGGSGGIDSQLVAFKASPNERVSVTKPGQSMGNGGVDFHMTVINQAGVDVKPSQDSSGNLVLTLRKMVSDTIAGGFADGALKGRHGLQPVKARRT